MTQTFSGDGRTVGAVMLLQALLTHVIAKHPDRDFILGSVKNFAEGMTADAMKAGSEGKPDLFVFLTEVADGIADTAATVTETVQALVAAG